MSEEITAPEAPETAQPEAPNTSLPQLEDVEEAMRDVVDPELGINVVDLGLVYGIEVTDEAVDEMMAVIDADGSGDVDFEEL